MDIFFSTLDRKEVYKLPIIPANMPELNKSAKNEEFETYNSGVINIPGNVNLVTFSVDCWLPEYAGKYPWDRSQINPYDLINLWSNAMINKTPIRCVIDRGQNKYDICTQLLNWLVTVENLSYYTENDKDIKYKVDLKQYNDFTGLDSVQNQLKGIIA